jgi:hypothetical protein
MAERKARKREGRRASGPREIPAAARPRPTGAAFPMSLRWAAVILGVLVIGFFHALVFEGKTFGSPDAVAPAGFVRMGEKALYQEHIYPLWNPYVFLGMPSFGSGAYNPLIYPPDWPLALVAKVIPLPDMTWLLLYYFLGGLFLYLLAVEWGAAPLGALIGGAAWAFVPNLVAVGAWGHGSQLVDSAYLPLLLWLTARWMRRGGLHHLAWLALAGGFQLLRGHVQVCFYTWMAVAIYVAIEAITTAVKRPAELQRVVVRGAGIALAAGLAFGLAGFYNLPLKDYARWSIRGGGEGGGLGMARATAWSLAPYELPTLVIPGWTGFGGASYWGGMPFTDYPNAYVGIVPFLLLLPAFLANGAPRLFAIVVSAVALLIAFGSHFPLYAFLYDHLPLFNKFRIPVMIVVLVDLAAALGAAWGWSELLRAHDGDDARRRALDRMLMVTGALLVVGLLVVVGAQGAVREAYLGMIGRYRHDIELGRQSFSPDAAAAAWGEFSGSWTRAMVLGLFAVGLGWLAARGRVPATLASGLALILVLVELWPVSTRVMERAISDVVPHSLDVGRDDTVEFLEKAGPPGSFRILPVQEFQSNRFAGFGIASVGGYHAAKTKLVQDLLDKDLALNPAWLRLLNVRYMVLDRPMPQLPPGFAVAHQGAAEVLEFQAALPRVTLVSRVEVVRPAIAILDSVATGRYDSGTMAFVEQDPGVPLGPIHDAGAVISSYGMNQVVVDAKTDGPALLRLADLWYPDWAVTVDGRPATLLKLDYLLRGVVIPAGSHRVVFSFRSASVRQGLTLSLGSFAVILALFGVAWWSGRRAVRPASPAPAGA